MITHSGVRFRWVMGYHLGVVRSPAPNAMHASGFVKRDVVMVWLSYTRELYATVQSELHTVRTWASALLYITIGSITWLSTPCSRVIYLSAGVLSAKPHTHEWSYVAKHSKEHLWHTYLWGASPMSALWWHYGIAFQVVTICFCTACNESNCSVLTGGISAADVSCEGTLCILWCFRYLYFIQHTDMRM